MADFAELKQMVLSFRVSELQELLEFAGRNKCGRKQELTQRALTLVQKGCSLPVQIKIRELFRQTYPVNKTPTSLPSLKDVNMPVNVMHRHPGMIGYPPEGPVGLDYTTISNPRPVIPQIPIPVHPDVKLKHLPFYDVLAEIMKPASLIPKNTGRMQETLFVFHLTPQQAQDITMSRDFRPGAKNEYTVQVQVRFCLLESTSEQADTFPSQIQVRVNNKPAILPNIIPTNKPNVEPKRPGRPLDVTSLCRLSPTVSNAITVSWATDFTRLKPASVYIKATSKQYGGPIDITYLCMLSPNKPNNILVSWLPQPHWSFCMSVYLVRKLSSDILLSRLKQFGNRHSDHTKALIKEKLAQDPDSEIATTSLRVSLMCPLGKMCIQIPCRASTCTHLQCFDASTFLMMNERKPTWMCPVCDRPCPYDKLIIDGYFVDIFRQSPSCTDIIFHEDGSWSPMKPQKENSSQVVLTNTAKVSVLSSASSSLPAQSQASSSVMMTMTIASSAPPKPPAAKGPVIDLTLDSSDEDDDVVIPSDPVAVTPPPAPFINLDTPSPAPLPTMPGSPSVILSSPQSASPSPVVSSHPHSYQSSLSYSGPPSHSSSNHNSGDSPLSAVDSILQTPPSLAQTSPSSSLQSQALNLEAMSDADFDEFLKGLSWGV